MMKYLLIIGILGSLILLSYISKSNEGTTKYYEMMRGK